MLGYVALRYSSRLQLFIASLQTITFKAIKRYDWIDMTLIKKADVHNYRAAKHNKSRFPLAAVNALSDDSRVRFLAVGSKVKPSDISPGGNGFSVPAILKPAK